MILLSSSNIIKSIIVTTFVANCPFVDSRIKSRIPKGFNFNLDSVFGRAANLITLTAYFLIATTFEHSGEHVKTFLGIFGIISDSFEGTVLFNNI